MKLEKIERLEVYWYETFNDKNKVIPTSSKDKFYRISWTKMVNYQDGMWLFRLFWE